MPDFHYFCPYLQLIRTPFRVITAVAIIPIKILLSIVKNELKN